MFLGRVEVKPDLLRNVQAMVQECGINGECFLGDLEQQGGIRELVELITSTFNIPGECARLCINQGRPSSSTGPTSATPINKKCSFCQGPITEQWTSEACQRCGDTTTTRRIVCVVLHDSDFVMNSKVVRLKKGQVVCMSKSLAFIEPTVSVEVHFETDTLPKLHASKEVTALLQMAHEHYHVPQHKSLRKREAFNTQWLLDLFAHSLPNVSPSARKHRSRENHPAKQFKGANTTSDTFNAWLDTSAPFTLLKNKAALFSPRRFALTAKKTAKHRCRREAIYATHLIFMMTDWLLRPWGFSNFKDANSLLNYIKDAHDVLFVHRANEVELYIEVAACLGVLTNDRRLLSEARQFIQELDWERALLFELKVSKTRRFKEDVALHMLILRAWFLAVDDQFQQLALCAGQGTDEESNLAELVK